MQSPLVKISWAVFMAVSLLVAVNVTADGIMQRSQSRPPMAKARADGDTAQTAAAPAKPVPRPTQVAADTQAQPREANPGHGAAVARKCAGCHTLEAGQPNRVGPNLHAIVGATVAARDGYAYSEPMKAKGGTWTREALDAFLTAPTTVVSGTRMAFPGLPNGEDRADLIAYLEALASRPAMAVLPAAEPAAEASPVAAVPSAAVTAAPEAAPEAVAEPVTGASLPPADDLVPPIVANGPPMRAELAILLANANADRGRKLAKACAECHSFEAKGGKTVGPTLRGVVNRDIGSQPGFAYSVTLTALEGNWIYDWLDQYLAQPQAFAPGSSTTFAGLDSAEDRADVIAFLRSLSPQAPPLPSPSVFLVPVTPDSATN